MVPKTTDEFNDFWLYFLEDNHYGLCIENEKVIAYLHEEFTKEVEKDSNFHYSQIKLKFNSSRVYTSSEKSSEWEKEIDKIIKNG